MAEIKTLDPKTLKSWLDNNEVLLIDVREPAEYNDSYIEKAVNIPLSQLLTKIQEIPNLGKKKIVLQCKSGIRSMTGCQSLKDQGFNENLWTLEGGIYAWSSSGFSTKSIK